MSDKTESSQVDPALADIEAQLDAYGCPPGPVEERVRALLAHMSLFMDLLARQGVIRCETP